ncbi:MAG: hypothetical protein ACRDSH_22400 [Pseudonocardiaceae bacterium]
MAEIPARWVISPTDGKAHSLVQVGDHLPGVLGARCGRLLPVGVVAHDHLPGWQWCLPCLWGYLVPPPVFSRKTPAGHRWNPAPFGFLAASRYHLRCRVLGALPRGPATAPTDP